MASQWRRCPPFLIVFSCAPPQAGVKKNSRSVVSLKARTVPTQALYFSDEHGARYCDLAKDIAGLEKDAELKQCWRRTTGA